MRILKSIEKIVVIVGGMKMLGTLRKEHVMNVDKSVILNRIVPSSRERRKNHLHSKREARTRERKLTLHGRALAHLPLHHQALVQAVKKDWQMCV
jgi:hypothetical protein